MHVFETLKPLQIPSRDACIICVEVDATWSLNNETDMHNTRSVTTHQQDHLTQNTYDLDLADTVKTIRNTILHYGSFSLPETGVLAEQAEFIRCRVDVEIGGETSNDTFVFNIQYNIDNFLFAVTMSNVFRIKNYFTYIAAKFS